MRRLCQGIALLISIIALIHVVGVHAQTNGTNGQGLEISPPVIELSGDPGQTVKATIRLRNITKGDLVTSAEVDDFGAAGEEGEPKLFLNDSEKTTYSIKQWIASPPSNLLKSQQAISIPITIKLPKDAEPGGHYGVVRFSGRPPELADTGVALQASLGSLILLRVSGATQEKLSFAEFFTERSSHKHGVFETGPVTFVERLKNAGNVHLKPTGTVDVYNMFGKKSVSIKVNDPPHNILPDSIRRFEQNWSSRFMFGRYRARVNLTYGDSKKSLASSSIVFWVIPYKLIVIILLLLAVLIFGGRWLLHRYNARVLRKHRRY